jgi:hypothetical protein
MIRTQQCRRILSTYVFSWAQLTAAQAQQARVFAAQAVVMFADRLVLIAALTSRDFPSTIP